MEKANTSKFQWSRDILKPVFKAATEKTETSIDVVQYVNLTQEKKYAPVLEKKVTFNGIGKTKGFNLDDMKVIAEKWDDIVAALQFK